MYAKRSVDGPYFTTVRDTSRRLSLSRRKYPVHELVDVYFATVMRHFTTVRRTSRRLGILHDGYASRQFVNAYITTDRRVPSSSARTSRRLSACKPRKGVHRDGFAYIATISPYFATFTGSPSSSAGSGESCRGAEGSEGSPDQRLAIWTALEGFASNGACDRAPAHRHNAAAKTMFKASPRKPTSGPKRGVSLMPSAPTLVPKPKST